MTNRMFLLAAFAWAAFGLTMTPVLAQSGSTGQGSGSTAASAWTLPQDTAVIDAGPRTYRFSVVYSTANKTGEIVRRQRVAGDYTRGLPHDEVEWTNVTVEDANGDAGAFAAPQKQTFMDGFRYRNKIADSFSPEFFKSFPPTAAMERNLVWDTGMIEMFGQNYLGQLKLNQPLHIISDEDVKMPEVGTFRNRDVVLEWVGRSQRNGQECALIDYRAFFNPLQVGGGGVTLDGRSDYWGEIWVSLATRQIEYATLYEEVTGEMKLPNQTVPQPLSIFRIGSFEPLSAGH